jgi:hypothetical protein
VGNLTTDDLVEVKFDLRDGPVGSRSTADVRPPLRAKKVKLVIGDVAAEFVKGRFKAVVNQ